MHSRWPLLTRWTLPSYSFYVSYLLEHCFFWVFCLFFLVHCGIQEKKWHCFLLLKLLTELSFILLQLLFSLELLFSWIQLQVRNKKSFRHTFRNKASFIETTFVLVLVTYKMNCFYCIHPSLGCYSSRSNNSACHVHTTYLTEDTAGAASQGCCGDISNVLTGLCYTAIFFQGFCHFFHPNIFF